ncbi:metalloendopeptidase [Aureococcus anophagefferens]|uniref:Metalloendopeptidase n=1 Tax=Aureococcus anophagefferens TaxID=44056 RepID=A0ABR1FHX5_AURAN
MACPCLGGGKPKKEASVAPEKAKAPEPPAAEPVTAQPAAPAPAPPPAAAPARRRRRPERYAAAVLKMRENKDGAPGTSEYFRLAVMHGGMPELPRASFPEYCVHGQEAFPTWHRPYLLDFERALRRADLALGNDGNIGLPYWDWCEPEVNGEILPGIVRKKLMTVPFPDDFFPPAYHEGKKTMNPRWAFDPALDVAEDWRIKMKLDGGSVARTADRCLSSTFHGAHACTSWSDHANPSVESCHNSIHMYVGGIMGGFQSAFHPVFWLHHCNVDRLYESYLAVEPDSAAEFEKHQRSLGSAAKKADGFPEGPWGIYCPFTHHASGEPYHAKHSFDTPALGFVYDALATPSPPQMREMPYFATFPAVDVTKLELGPCSLHVYVVRAGDAFAAPAGDDRALLEAPGYAGSCDVFFIDNPAGCANCATRPPFDEHVDVTAALRALDLRPKDVALHVLVTFPRGGDAKPAADVPGVPTPVLKGPRLASMENSVKEGDADDDAAEVLKLLGKEPGAGFTAEVSDEVKKIQRAAGLVDDGVVGPKTKPLLLNNFHGDDLAPEGAASWKPGDTVGWTIELDTVPPSLDAAALGEVAAAQFAKWSAATGIAFARDDAAPKLTLAWKLTSNKDVAFSDGPGGQLANATLETIVFDKAEKWELDGRPHPRRKFDGEPGFFDPYFKVAPVLLHEIGHVLGLDHSSDPSDVMAPYYMASKLELTDADVAKAKAKLGA